jgi:hypothetical protein
MKKIVISFVALLFVSFCSFAQTPQLVKLWQTDSVFKTPESVLYDAGNKVLYVSNIDGTDPWGKDDKGSIGKLGLDGKIITVEWVKGLQSPKGMGLRKGMLYVADQQEVVVIDIKKGQIIKRISVEGSVGLNDISIDNKGIIFVTDSRGKKLYRIENEKASLYIESLQGPNGVLAHDGKLIIVDNGGLYSVDANKKLNKIADGMEGGTDGIEHVQNGEYIVSCWAGITYYVKPDGSKHVLIDTRDEKSNTADIGYDPAKKIVYVPTFWRNSVAAYQLK